MKNYVLITKDAMCRDYLPVYGNRVFKTPNIDELAEKGTVYKRHYTAAPSTVMSFFSMVTGLYAHETPYEMYEQKHIPFTGETIFSKVKKIGYKECHIIWDDAWGILPKYFDCYHNDVTLHYLKDFRQAVGAHYIHDGELIPNIDVENRTYCMVENKIKSIMKKEGVFLWIHFPHVINGCVAYGSDIELFDRYVGMIRKYFDDDAIAISTDHGNMNGHKGKLGYGHDVYEPAIRIPLITPRIDSFVEYNGLTSNVDLFNIIFKNTIPLRKCVFSDSAYKAQQNRKLAIIGERYKYIYNKKNKIEELYDLYKDDREDFSLMYDNLYDVDRKLMVPVKELYYYPDWDLVYRMRTEFQKLRLKIWKDGSIIVVLKSNLKDTLRPFYEKFSRKRI